MSNRLYISLWRYRSGMKRASRSRRTRSPLTLIASRVKVVIGAGFRSGYPLAGIHGSCLSQDITVLRIKEERMISKILVPTDGSKTAHKAARYAMELAKLSGATVIVLSVIDRTPFISPSMPGFVSPSRPGVTPLHGRSQPTSRLANLQPEN